MKLSRRLVLRGIGGAVLGLPLLEGLSGSRAQADGDAPPFAIFLRQANGVAAAQDTSEIGSEPERFWPRDLGPLTRDSMAGRALEELDVWRDRLLVVRNINMEGFDYGDGHARGALQCLTARGPTVAGAGGDSEAAGESIDHRIGAEVNPDGRDSWFLYAGRNGGWLGGPCVSYRGPANRRSAIHDPYEAYRTLVGGDAGLSAEAQRQIAERGRSVNDLVRSQLIRLQSRPELSAADKRRLDLHQSAIRDLEVRLSCQLDMEREAALEGAGSIYDSTDGDEVLAATRLHMDVAALAVACGVTRSVAIQVGSGNDGSTRYRDPTTGEQMENFHYLSHRRLSHGADGTIISDSDVKHAYVDRQFAQTFRHLLSRLAEYEMPSGGTLLDCGLAIWFNDLGNGPAHSRMNTPWIIAGSAGGQLRQGEYVEASGGERVVNHAQLLNTIGTAVGATNGSGGPLDDFGDPSLPGGLLDELFV
ncbi:MAG TPA: DUF1552 domain-containing protein [Sandaracinaceae bacterium LLY-WYZ-13_1]|nr:DUF1552 domain-containing protein [Sandaracinaceae bacterium LLY-WYZ-13_1]